MKFSIFTASTPDWDPQTVAHQAAQLGYQGIEWRVTDQEEATPPGFWAGNRATFPYSTLNEDLGVIRALSEETGLEISALGGYRQASDHEGVLTMLKATAAVGASQVRVTLPLLGPAADYASRVNARDIVSQAQEDLAWAAEQARELGVKALIETHHRTIASSASGALRLIDGLDPNHIGVIHDSGNMVIEGQEDYLFGFHILGDYLAHVHVKNAHWQPESSPQDSDGAAPTPSAAHESGVQPLSWEPDQSPVWAGIADLDAYFAALKAVNYQGWVTLEDFSTQEPLEERMRHNLGYLQHLAHKHGLS